MASGPGGTSDGHDAELDELLDSALDDFDKASIPPAPEPAAASSSASSGAQKDTEEVRPLLGFLYRGEGVTGPGEISGDVGAKKPEGGDRFHSFSLYNGRGMDLPVPPEVYYEFFSFKDVQLQPPLLEDCKLFETLFEGDMAAQAKEEWEKAMTELAQEEPELLQHFQKLSEAAGKVGTDTASQQEFTSCLKETLQGLAKNADNLKSSGLAGDDLVKALEGLGLEEGEGGGDDGNILPIMQSIMQNLLSKEVLYPSLKEITTKYPEWLETNKPSLSPEDYQRYEQQAKIMGEICKLFEREEEGAADKESTFERIMDLMQKLQDLGQPPKELAGDAPPGFNFDMDSLNLPGGPGAGSAEQCSVM